MLCLTGMYTKAINAYYVMFYGLYVRRDPRKMSWLFKLSAIGDPWNKLLILKHKVENSGNSTGGPRSFYHVWAGGIIQSQLKAKLIDSVLNWMSVPSWCSAEILMRWLTPEGRRSSRSNASPMVSLWSMKSQQGLPPVISPGNVESFIVFRL